MGQLVQSIIPSCFGGWAQVGDGSGSGSGSGSGGSSSGRNRRGTKRRSFEPVGDMQSNKVKAEALGRKAKVSGPKVLGIRMPSWDAIVGCPSSWVMSWLNN